MDNGARKVRDLLEIQGRDGIWDCDDYMQGLYNGLEMALATLEDREPVFRSKPPTGWLADRAMPVVNDTTEASSQ